MRIIDISQEVLSCQIYPGDPVPQIEQLYDMNQGDLYNLSSFYMCAHNGTHIDAPAHFAAGGKTVDQIPLDQLIGECYVAHHTGDLHACDAESILNEAGACQKLLIQGDAVIMQGAAEVFASSGIHLLGVESQSAGPMDSPMAVHLVLLNAGIVILEGLVLKEADKGRYFLSAAALNLKGIEGSPCRAYLIDLKKNTRV